MRFFERFRSAVSRYGDGVHLLESPASKEALAAHAASVAGELPEAYREFLLQFNGAYLFHDDYHLVGTDDSSSENDDGADAPDTGDLLRFGAGPSSELYFDRRGRVIAVDEETESARVEGSSFERWLDALLAREAVVYDRDGEFRDGVFDGGELAEKARRKRAVVALKADPDAPAWHEEMAELHVEAGELRRAVDELELAVGLEPELSSAWFELGKLRLAGGGADPGDRARSLEAFRRAGETAAEPTEAAFAFAHAARVAASLDALLDGERAKKESSDEARRAMAARAVSLEPGFVEQQRAASEHLISIGDLDGAVERVELALAILPDDESLRELLSRTRARRSLRTI